MKSAIIRSGWLVVLLVVAPVRVHPQDEDYAKAHYTKYEYTVAMRDGTKLFTAVYAPKDRSQTYPIMLTRTPYNVAPYGPENFKTQLGPSDLFMKDGFIFVYQDVRGAWMSEGQYADIRPICADQAAAAPAGKPACLDESTDTYDTIEWLLKNVSGHNGRVGIWGISYPGYYTSAGMIAAHPALKAASPQAPVTEWFLGDDFHHNGALYLAHAFRFYNGFGTPRPQPTPKPRPPAIEIPTQDGYRFYLEMGPLANANARYFKNQVAFWNELMIHPTYDAFWQARDVRRHLTNITPAVLTVGGWFDAEDLYGALEVYKTVEKNNPGASNQLVMGPWFHGGWSRSAGEGLGPVRFDAKTGNFFREQIELPFFKHLLKDGADPKLPDAYVFDTGRNEWRTFDAWPPKAATSRSLYLQAGGRLAFEPARDTAAAYDEYVSDPMKPVPFQADIAQGMTREHMAADQRFAASRTDVLTYQSDVLSDEVTVAGPIRPRLVVSTSGTDSDWVVKLIDVYPDSHPDAQPTPDSPSTQTSTTMGGYAQLVRGELMRGRFRNSFEKPEAFEPNAPTKVEYVMPDVLHTFRRGHRIMVQIQSSWFPLVDRNPQKFVDIYKATDADFQKATERVYRSAAQRSAIEVSVLP